LIIVSFIFIDCEKGTLTVRQHIHAVVSQQLLPDQLTLHVTKIINEADFSFAIRINVHHINASTSLVAHQLVVPTEQ
jgi:hypothetical protein